MTPLPDWIMREVLYGQPRHVADMRTVTTRYLVEEWGLDPDVAEDSIVYALLMGARRGAEYAWLRANGIDPL